MYILNESEESERLYEIKDKVIKNLDQYKSYIIANYNSIDGINIESIIKQLNDEFGEDEIESLNVHAFLRKINQILQLKIKKGKRDIKLEFSEYYNSLEHRINSMVDDVPSDYDDYEGEGSLISRKQYEKEKYVLQIELLKLQEWVMKTGSKVAIVFEGRDSAGKGSTIKRFTEYLNPKGFKVVALGMPTEEEKNNWFDRYEKQLPKDGQIVFFDRSWYNRAVVEPSLGYCTEDQYINFMDNVNKWEEQLVKDGVILIKFWFSITKEKQLQRFDLRKSSPLKYWKFSANDEKVVNKWDLITQYKNQMFDKTSTPYAPWVIISANDKKLGRLNAIRYVLSVIDYDNKNVDMTKYYPEVVNVLG